MPNLFNLPPHIYVFAAILGVLLLSFLVLSVLPSLLISRRLSKVNARLLALKGKPNDNLDQIFHNTGIIQHLWQEYSDTLHRQSSAGEQSIRFRSTMPAIMIFRPEVLVDVPLRTDFFKHLPGLFTGVGIIGTFYGLLIGLQSFEVSENPVIVRASLSQLLHGVSQAFIVSAAAISLAMLVTLIEKIIVTRLNAQAEKLAQLLDGLFESGAGEEYLARLVKASETSAAQSSNLLQGELKQVLSELFEQQTLAANSAAAALGDKMVLAMQKNLHEPLAEIAHHLKNGGVDQGTAMETMLVRVMEDFSNKIVNLFDGQVGGMQSMQQQTLLALQGAVQTLQEMSAEMGASSQRNTSSLSEQLSQSIAAAEARQQIMNEQLGEFVAQMHSIVSTSQSASQSQLQSILTEMSERMAGVIDALTQQVRTTTDATLKNQLQFNANNQQTSTQMNEQMSAVVEGVNRAVTEMKAVALALRNTNQETMSKLTNGADTLYLAAKDFARAGEGVTATLDKSSAVVTQLTQSATAIGTATTGLSGLFADYSAARDAMQSGIGSLQSIMEQLQREASMSGDVLARIESATQKLSSAQKETERYLAGVSEVIATAHSSFSEGMSRAVGEANRDFHQALSDSVKLLREGIQELESTLDSVGSL